jgi:hypothetical protein
MQSPQTSILETTVRHFFNVVSAGILLGLSLFAISVLTALYASPWQAATILAVLVGIFASVSLYFGGRAETQAIAQELANSQARVRALSDSLTQAQEQVQTLANSLAQAEVNLHEYGHNLVRDALVIVYLVVLDEIEEEPPLFI